MPIRIDDSDGNTIHARTRFSLVRREDGTADVLFYPVLVESRLERFSEEQKQRLLEGKAVIALMQGDCDTPVQAFHQIDTGTKQILSVPTPVIGRNLQIIAEKQLQALTDWGTNFVNRKCYNTFASIVAADFDLPRDFVHARNANGRVAMGLHGYRIGAGEYGRLGRPFPMRHPWGACFLGWTPRQQEGFHLRRIGGNLYYPGAPMVPNRSDGRMKPGELQSGGYGFYYKGHPTTTVAGQDVLEELETVITPLQPRPRPTEPAKPYHMRTFSSKRTFALLQTNVHFFVSVNYHTFTRFSGAR